MIKNNTIWYDNIYISENVNGFHNILRDNAKIPHSIIDKNNFIKIKLFPFKSIKPDISVSYESLHSNMYFNMDENKEIFDSVLTLNNKRVNIIFSNSKQYEYMDHFTSPRLLNVFLNIDIDDKGHVHLYSYWYDRLFDK